MSTTEHTPGEDAATLKDSVQQAIAAVKENPQSAAATFRARSVLEHGLKADIKVRNFRFVSDEPESLGGTDEGPNPVEYVLAALAACQEIVVKAYAAVLDIQVHSVSAEVDGDIDLRGFFNLADVRAGFNQVRFNTRIVTSETDKAKLELLEQLAEKNCPVLDIIQHPVPVSGSFTFVNN